MKPRNKSHVTTPENQNVPKPLSEEAIYVDEMPALNQNFHTRAQESIAHLWIRSVPRAAAETNYDSVKK